MSRNLLAINVSELNTIRVICGKCKIVTEMTVGQLGERTGYTCPGCGTVLGAASPSNLAKAIEFLQKYNEFTFEFVIPAGPKSDTEKK